MYDVTNLIILCVFQHRDVTECVRPMFKRILELQEDCEDETLQRKANTIVSLLRGNAAELMGDRLGDVVDEYIENPNFHDISE